MYKSTFQIIIKTLTLLLHCNSPCFCRCIIITNNTITIITLSFQFVFVLCLALHLVSAGKLVTSLGFPSFRMQLLCVYEDQLSTDQFSMILLCLSFKKMHTVLFKCSVPIAKVVSITAEFISDGSGGRSNPGACSIFLKIVCQSTLKFCFTYFCSIESFNWKNG